MLPLVRVVIEMAAAAMHADFPDGGRDPLPLQLCVWTSRCAAHVPQLFLLSNCGAYVFTAAAESPRVYVWEALQVERHAIVPRMILSTEAHEVVIGLLDYKTPGPRTLTPITSNGTSASTGTGANTSTSTSTSTQPSRSHSHTHTPPGRKAFDHKLLCVGSNGVISQWCARSGRCLRVSPSVFVEASYDTLRVEASPDAARAVLLLRGTLVIVLDVRTLQILAEVQVHAGIQRLSMCKGSTLGWVTQTRVFLASLHVDPVRSSGAHERGGHTPAMAPSDHAAQDTMQQQPLHSPTVASVPRRSPPPASSSPMFETVADFSLPASCRPSDPMERARVLCWSPSFDAFLLLWPSRWTLASAKWLRAHKGRAAGNAKSKKKHTLYSHGPPPRLRVGDSDSASAQQSIGGAGHGDGNPALAASSQRESDSDDCDDQSPSQRWHCAHFMLGSENVVATDDSSRTFLFVVSTGRRSRSSMSTAGADSRASPAGGHGQFEEVLESSTTPSARAAPSFSDAPPVCQLVSARSAAMQAHDAPGATRCSTSSVVKVCLAEQCILLWRCDALMQCAMEQAHSASQGRAAASAGAAIAQCMCDASIFIGPNWTGCFTSASMNNLSPVADVAVVHAWHGVLLAQPVAVGEQSLLHIRSYLPGESRDWFLGCLQSPAIGPGAAGAEAAAVAAAAAAAAAVPGRPVSLQLVNMPGVGRSPWQPQHQNPEGTTSTRLHMPGTEQAHEREREPQPTTTSTGAGPGTSTIDSSEGANGGPYPSLLLSSWQQQQQPQQPPQQQQQQQQQQHHHRRLVCVATGRVGQHPVFVATDSAGFLFACALVQDMSAPQGIRVVTARAVPPAPATGRICRLTCPPEQDAHRQHGFFLAMSIDPPCAQLLRLCWHACSSLGERPLASDTAHQLLMESVFVFQGFEAPVLAQKWLLARHQLVLTTSTIQYVWSLTTGVLQRVLDVDTELAADEFDSASSLAEIALPSAEDDGCRAVTLRPDTTASPSDGHGPIHYGLVRAAFDFLRIGYNVFPSAHWVQSHLLPDASAGAFNVSSPRVHKAGMCTVFFPSTEPFVWWKRSGVLTAHTLVTLLKIFIKIIEANGSADPNALEQANNAVFVYTNKLPSLVGSEFAAPSQSELAKFVTSASKLTHVAARLILNATVAGHTEQETVRLMKKVQARNAGEAFSAAFVVPLMSCVLHPQWTPSDVARRFAHMLVRGMQDGGVEVNSKCLLIEYFGKGFPIWRPYLPSTISVVMNLQQLMLSGNASLRTTALRALLEMGQHAPILLIDLVSAAESVSQRTSSHCSLPA